MSIKGNSKIQNKIYVDTNIIICCSHNNRLECFFRHINNNYINKSFNNCAIIRCYKDNNNVKFMMIYEGESYGTDIASICSITNGCWDIVSFNNYFNNYSYDIKLPDNTEIFLIRHALGVHNKMSIIQKIFNLRIDSVLDIIGIEQAKRLGIFLKGYIDNFYKNNNIVFTASHLTRTQQTIGIIMNMMNIINININKIYIVPCIHELNISSNTCGSSIIEYIPIASNIPRCRNNNNSCDKLDILNNIYDVDWSYYIEFNKLSITCKNTDIISQIINTVSYS
jgi:hypothetical protein